MFTKILVFCFVLSLVDASSAQWTYQGRGLGQTGFHNAVPINYRHGRRVSLPKAPTYKDIGTIRQRNNIRRATVRVYFYDGSHPANCPCQQRHTPLSDGRRAVQNVITGMLITLPEHLKSRYPGGYGVVTKAHLLDTDSARSQPEVEVVVNLETAETEFYYALVAAREYGRGKDAALLVIFPDRELRTIMKSEILKLPEREKLVLSLYYDEGLTLAEIGDVLGVTESRVSQIHTKSVLHLRSRMSAAGVG